MRSKWETRTRPHGRVEWVDALYFWAAAWVLFLGAIPVAVAMVVGTFQGTATDGLFFPAAEYPAFTTLSGWLIIPAVTLLVAAVLAVPLPLEDRQGPKRGDIAWLAVFGIAVSLTSLVLDDGRPAWQEYTPHVAAVIFALVVVIVLLRAVLAASKLLPRHWRGNYRDEDLAQ